MDDSFDGTGDLKNANAPLKTPTTPFQHPERQIQKLANSVATSLKATAAEAEAEVVSSLASAESSGAAGTATAIAASVIAAAQAAAVTVEAAAAAAAAALAVQAAAAAVIALAVEETLASSVQAAAVEAQAATTAAAVAVQTAVRAAALAVALAEKTAVQAARALATEKATAQALQSALNDKQALLREVHHRVKNNLQIVVSLLRLEAGRSTHSETKSVLQEMQARIRSMALLHESLYRSDTFAMVDLGVYLKALATEAFRFMGGADRVLHLQLTLGSLQVGMDQAIATGLLVNELISNCFKHSFPDGGRGEVGIELQPSNERDTWRLRVSDTGIGLPADFEEKRKTSLGLQLVSDLVKQIGGTLAIESIPSQGAQFTVVFTAKVPAHCV